MSKQDRQGVRTPADLERKYNFGQNFSGQNQQISRLNQNVTQLEQRLSDTNGKVEELKKAVSDLPELEQAVKTVNGITPNEDGAVVIDTKDLTDEEIAKLLAYMQ